MSGGEVVRLLFGALVAMPVVAQHWDQYSDDTPNVSILRMYFQATQAIYQLLLNELFPGQDISRLRDSQQDWEALEIRLPAGQGDGIEANSKLLEEFARHIHERLEALDKEFRKEDRKENGIRNGPLNTLTRVLTQQDKRRRSNIMRILKYLGQDLLQFKALVNGYSTYATLQVNQHAQPTGRDQGLELGSSFDLNLLFESLASTLGACKSKCDYHHIHLLLTELEPNKDSYCEKIPKEDTSRVSVFIPTKTGEMTAHEWRSLELELHPETEPGTHNHTTTAISSAHLTNGLTNGVKGSSPAFSSYQQSTEEHEGDQNLPHNHKEHPVNGFSSDCKEIDNICDTISNPYPWNSEPFNFLGRIQGDDAHSFHLYNTKSMPNHPASSDFGLQPKIIKTLKVTQRLELARRAALSFLQVTSTDWPLEPQEKECIFVASGESLTRSSTMGIYVSRIFMVNMDSTDRNGSLPTLTNPALYGLALQLIELCLRRRFDPEKSFSEAHKLMKKSTITSKFGKSYKAAIDFCLKQATGPDLGEKLQEEFQKQVYDNIVETCRLFGVPPAMNS